jgi:lipid-A-disaccharide synthase
MREGPTIFLSAAEASGDHHAAGLIRELSSRLPGARFVGAAGPAMQAAGCESLVDLTGAAAMLGGPLLKLHWWRRQVKMLQRAIVETKPDLLIPTDSPALHWHLCKAARAAGVGVLYYVAPQVWAWAPWRIKKVRRLVDRLACILPFEEEYFSSRGVEAKFVGHPLFDQLPPARSADACPDLASASQSGAWTIALLPGSRGGEIARLAPAMAASARAIRARWPEATCTFTAVDDRAARRIKDAAGSEIPIAVGRTDEVLAASHFALAASGTVTLQVAHFGLPMVILYRIGLAQRIGYHVLFRHLIRTPHLSLVNILAGRRLVPELMPDFGSQTRLDQAVLPLLGDLDRLTRMRGELLELVAALQAPPGQTAAGNVADMAMEML